MLPTGRGTLQALLLIFIISKTIMYAFQIAIPPEIYLRPTNFFSCTKIPNSLLSKIVATSHR